MTEPIGFAALLQETNQYLAFFQARAQLEQQYADSLQKLAVKLEESDRRAVDEGIRPAPSTLRTAWVQLRKDVAREATSRQTYAVQLRKLCVDPLAVFRDAKERVRRRIKDDLRSASSEHGEYRQVVARLQKTYERRTDELRALQSEASAPGSDGGQSNADSSPPHSPPVTGAYVHVLSPESAFTAVTSVTPVQSHPHLPPGAAPPLKDALRTGQKQFNNLIQRIGGGGDHHRQQELSPGQLAVHKRREAEDADSDYRRAVYHMDTLRLRRDHIGRSALASAEEFAFDLSTTMRLLLGSYAEATRHVGVGGVQAAETAEMIVHEISPEYGSTLPFDVAPEPRILYDNQFVGQCKSLLFGLVSLEQYAAAHETLVPRLLTQAIAEIDARGLDAEGIYRIPGRSAVISRLVLEVEKDEQAFEFDPNRHDVFSIAGLLKLFLRQLPVPLLSLPAQDRMAISRQLDTPVGSPDRDEALRALRQRIRRLGPAHQATLVELCAHLARVASPSANNKMDAGSLGVVLAPVVFGDDDLDPHALRSDRCMEALIAHHAVILEGLPMIPAAAADAIERSRARGRALSDAAGDEFPLRRNGVDAVQAVSARKPLSIRRRRKSSPPPDARSPRKHTPPPLAATPARQPSPGPAQALAAPPSAVPVAPATPPPVNPAHEPVVAPPYRGSHDPITAPSRESSPNDGFAIYSAFHAQPASPLRPRISASNLPSTSDGSVTLAEMIQSPVHGSELGHGPPPAVMFAHERNASTSSLPPGAAPAYPQGGTYEERKQRSM